MKDKSNMSIKKDKIILDYKYYLFSDFKKCVGDDILYIYIFSL